MPKNSDAKTESVRKNRRVYSVFFLVLIVIGVIAYMQLRPEQSVSTSNTKLNIEVVDTPQAITRGLSGRESITDDYGMLFVHDKDGKYCFWMKDMNFSIDMIWLTEDKEVVHIESNVSPQTYPKSFCPSVPARYVLEVAAGKAERSGWVVGSRALF